MNNMGQTSTEQWAPPWSQIKVYDGKETVGMEYTMLESYFESMYPMKSEDASSKPSVADGKITPDNPLQYNSAPVTSEKTGFEAEVAVTPPTNNICSPHKAAETVKDISAEKSTDNGTHCQQEVSFPTPLPECVIKEEPITVLDDAE
jgi:hypothetical protein